MTEPQDRAQAARTAVQRLMTVDKAKALTVAVLLASSSVAGCAALPENPPCSAQTSDAPCIEPSGDQSGWLSRPRWPALEESPTGAQGRHLATSDDFVANPTYTQLRAGADANGSAESGGPTYYGGGHYWLYSSGGSGSSDGGSHGGISG